MTYNEAPVSDVPKYIEDDNWFFQQKVDGIRGQLVLEPGKAPWFRSKSGDQLVSSTAAKISGPLLKKMGAGLPEGAPGYVVDGEMLDGKFYIFDMVPSGSEGLPWETRMKMAETWVQQMHKSGLTQIQALPTARTPDEKRALWEAVRDSGGEGVVMKRKEATYKFGQRVSTTLKAKVTSTADVVVIERNRGGKENAVIGLKKDGKVTEIGTVSMQGKEKFGKVNVGDIIEVEYLWANPDNNSLTQPRMLKRRPDKTDEDATIEQLRFVNKDVHDVVPLPEATSHPSTEAQSQSPEPWNSPEAVAALESLHKIQAETNRLNQLYTDWSENKGVAKQYGGGYQFKSTMASKYYAEYKKYKDETLVPARDAYLAQYAPPEPKQGIQHDDNWYQPTSMTKVGVLDADQYQKIRDMYVVPDEKTLAHNSSLRSPEPSSASKTWRSKVSRMVNNAVTTEDTTFYRVAAFTPAMIASLQPGAKFVDPGFMSTGVDEASSFSYGSVRTESHAGTIEVRFHLRVPAGTPAADVDYGEVVLDYGSTVEVLEIGMVDGVRTVIATVTHRKAK